jgi:hypothetical protein
MMWVSRSTSTLWASARLAARVGGKMRRDLRKLRVRQPEVVQNHRRSLSESRKRCYGPTFKREMKAASLIS